MLEFLGNVPNRIAESPIPLGWLLLCDIKRCGAGLQNTYKESLNDWPSARLFKNSKALGWTIFDQIKDRCPSCSLKLKRRANRHAEMGWP